MFRFIQSLFSKKYINIMTQEEIKNVFREKKLSEGRMISSSKSTYYRIYPENDVIFNCNLLTKNGKI